MLKRSTIATTGLLSGCLAVGLAIGIQTVGTTAKPPAAGGTELPQSSGHTLTGNGVTAPSGANSTTCRSLPTSGSGTIQGPGPGSIGGACYTKGDPPATPTNGAASGIGGTSPPAGSNSTSCAALPNSGSGIVEGPGPGSSSAKCFTKGIPPS